MISGITMENWRSHERTEMKFGRGANILIGQMGSGKTSAMNAISFALFGTFPDLQARKVKLDDVIMNKPAMKNHAKVTLDFEIGGKKYAIKREITRGKGTTSAALWQCEKMVEGPNPKRVEDKINELLKINYDLFSRAIYAEQNKIDYFLEIPKGQRKQKIDELLKIDKFESARKNVGTVISRLNDRGEELEKFVASAPKLETTELANEIQMHKKDADAFGKKICDAERGHGALEKEYSKISEKKEIYEAAKKKLEENSGKISVLRERAAKYGRVAKTKNEIGKSLENLNQAKLSAKRLEEEKRKLEKESEKFGAHVSKNRQMIEDFEKKISKITVDENAAAKKEKLRKKLQENCVENEKIICAVENCKTKIAEKKESLKILGDKESCPVCETELDEERRMKIVRKSHDEIGKLEKEIVACNKKIAEVAVEKGKLEADIGGLEGALRKLEEKKWLEENKKRVLEELKTAEQNFSEISQKISKIKIEKNADGFEKEIRECEKILEYFSFKEELEKSEATDARLKAELGKISYDDKEARGVYDELKACEKELALLKQEENNVRKLVFEKEKRLAEIDKIKKEIRNSAAEAEYLKKTCESLKMLQNVFQQTQGLLREQFTDTTNLLLTNVWEKLYPYKDYVDLKLAVDEAGDYVLQLKRRDAAFVNVEGVASGGERSISCLSLRIALSLVLTKNLSWLILDEPTHNLDRSGICELSKTIREHLPEIVEQVFVITHEEELESAASGSLIRLERNKEEDEPTRIIAEAGI